MSPSFLIEDPILLDFAEAVGAQQPVSVRGAATRWELGGPSAPGTAELRAPTGIVSHEPEEMIVRVRAGTPVAELHAALAAAGQRTVLPERGGTVGGALVVGESSIHRLGRGHVRESLLQARYVSASGVAVTAGGPTVKNVSGFDLCRLLVGSLGTLGLIGEVILRTQPIPLRSIWVLADGVEVGAICASVQASAVLTNGHQTWVHLEGYGSDVISGLTSLRNHGRFAEIDGPPPLPPHRASRPPSAVLSGPLPLGAVAEAGVGTLHCVEPQPPVVMDAGAALLNRKVKAAFDPTGRLNPGRDPGRR